MIRKDCMLNFAKIMLLFTLYSCNESAFNVVVNSLPGPTEPNGPTITSITPPENGTYFSGEVLTIGLNFSEIVLVTGVPRIQLSFDGSTKFANYLSGTGTSTLTFQYTISGVSDMNGIDLQANIDLNGGEITGTQKAGGTFSGVQWTNVFVSAGPGGAPAAVTNNCGGGCPANRFERPDMVLIERFNGTWYPSCMGVILSSRYILTTAACLDGVAESNLRVVAGLDDRRDFVGTQVQYVTSYKKHEGYNVGYLFANDLAIITLQRPLVLGFNVEATILAQPADGTFETFPTYTYSWIHFTGTGSTLTDFPNVWSGASYPVISTAEAVTLWSGIPEAVITDDHIVVKDVNLFGGFSSGSGSPMYVDSGGSLKLAGILSWAKSDGDPNYPSVGARISAYSGWITTNTP